MSYRKKYMSGADTTSHVTKCYFKKVKSKLPFPSLFQLQYFDKGVQTGATLFTGDELTSFSLKDSTGLVMKMDMWKKEIESRSDNYDLFDPFTSKDGHPLPKKSSFRDSSFRTVMHGQEKVGGINCYHIETREGVQMEGIDAKLPDFISHYWINTADYIPVQISQAFTMIMNMDTMVQYDLLTIDHYQLDGPFDDANISLAVIPAYIRMKEYTPYQRPDPLPLDTVAPEWSFPSLSDEMVSLESLKGKLVLIDFFYKSCMPCMQALPVLQSLHEKYKDKGLVVIGLDPYDDKEDNLAAFLAKRNVDYPILYASKEIAKTYRVSGYPTMFLVSKEGKIVNVQEGYGDTVEAKLEELILKNL